MIEVGTVLQNRYRIERKIGQGGMGAVYIATDERFGSVVAIKETFFTDHGYRKAFESEARLLNNLRHPALPRVSDHFLEEDGQFLVMEYIAGDDLSEKLETTGDPFPVNLVLDWANQLLDALDYLHTQEDPVVHRDIKPQNLKITARGQIILLDFGLAKGNPTDSGNQTAAKSVFGFSRNYAALEQIQGTGTDPRSDLYSLGATVYHLMTGKPPDDALTRAMKVLNGEPDPLQTADAIAPWISPEAAAVVTRAMMLNANQRPTSALAMQAMFAEAANTINQNDMTARPVSASHLLTQNTQVFTDAPIRAVTENMNNETEIEPSAHSSIPVPLNQTNHEVGNAAGDTNVKRKDQTPMGATFVNAVTVVENEPLPLGPKPGRKKLNAFAAAAVGGMLLIGGAAGTLFLLKPGNADPKLRIVEANADKPTNPSSSPEGPTYLNLANSNSAANGVNQVPADTLSSKKDNSQKPPDKPPAGDSSNPTSDPNAITATKRSKAENVETQNQNSGTLIPTAKRVDTPGGAVNTPGVVVRNPERGTSPDPPAYPDLSNLSPAERRRIINKIKRRNHIPNNRTIPPGGQQ